MTKSKKEIGTREDDFKKLDSLLEEEKLTEEEREAFEDMLKGLRDGIRRLSEKQRAWVDKAYKKYELDAGETQNLMSSGKVPRGKEIRMPYEDMPKPLKPPTRRIPNS